MKYMYILLCLLSSFFIYNFSLAKETESKYAFFIPNNAFQSNTDVKEIRLPQKQNLKKATQKSISNIDTTVDTQTTQPPLKLKKKLPIVIEELKPLVELKKENAPKPQNKYQLDEDVDPKALVKKDAPEIKEETIEEPVLSTFEIYKTGNIEELLRQIPYPDSSQPKFKQLYNLYALELRSLYKYKELPINTEQEETLKKANTIRRLEVK